MRYLSQENAQRFYDFFASREDSQAFYEDPALDVLVREGRFEAAASVFEFGCGTGRLAERLLDSSLSADASYAACDISPKMLALTRQRLFRFGARVSVSESHAGVRAALGERHFDRIMTSYVLDLLPPDEIAAFLEAAAGALAPDGLLCAASITSGNSLLSSFVSGAWTAVNRVSPWLTGGCRPIDLDRLLDPGQWSIRHKSTVVAWGVASSVVIATLRAASPSSPND